MQSTAVTQLRSAVGLVYERSPGLKSSGHFWDGDLKVRSVPQRPHIFSSHEVVRVQEEKQVSEDFRAFKVLTLFTLVLLFSIITHSSVGKHPTAFIPQHECRSHIERSCSA